MRQKKAAKQTAVPSLLFFCSSALPWSRPRTALCPWAHYSQAHPCTTNNSGALTTPHHLLLNSRIAPSGISLKSFFTLQQFLQVSKESEALGPECVGSVSMKLNPETASAKLKETLRCIEDQHSILLNEPHNLAVLPPTSISISSINRRRNNSSFLYIMQPLIAPDQILAPRGYSFCSVGNHLLDKMQQLSSTNVKCCRKPRRHIWILLITLIYHITALALTEHANHCWEQHGCSSDQKALASSCSAERQQIHTTTVR